MTIGGDLGKFGNLRIFFGRGFRNFVAKDFEKIYKSIWEYGDFKWFENFRDS